VESDILYRKLQRHLDRMPIGFPPTASGVEIRILQRLFTPDEAEIALELSAIPEPAATIHKRLKSRMDLAALTAALDRMAGNGVLLVFPIDGQRCYGKLMFAIGMYERQLKRLTPEFERDAHEYFEEAFGQAFHTKKTTQLRTVPVNRKIAVERNVATYDDIRAFVEASPGPFAAVPCICRHGRDLVGEKCRQTNLRENCLMMGPAAEFAVAGGMGRAITREEMLGLLDAADREGLVLQPENTRNPLFICCCCGCCCGVLGSAKRLPNPAEYFSASYYAVADADTCQYCGICGPRCQMDAVSMESGHAEVDRSRCIGCALCVTTCPSGALRLVPSDRAKLPPDDTKALYMQILKERYGPWGMALLGARKALGMKI
jgi:Na+-translocating ferredoxin:NAD+ oxidoreductase subunit B